MKNGRSDMIHRRKLLSELRDFLILIVLGVLMTWFGLSCRNCQEDTRLFMIMASFTSLLWILLWKGNDYLGGFITHYISWIKFPLKRFIVGVAVTFGYSIIVVLLLGFIWEKSFNVQLSLSIFVSVVITVTISLFMHGREFLINWRKTSIEAEKYEQETIKAKYDSLKNQLSPHFLFNSMNALSNLVYEDQEKAVRFIDQLEVVYKYVLETRGKEVVPLAEEIEFLKAYLFLQEIRFGSKLKVDFELREAQCFVAPLALQMLIENAIKHNIISQENPLTIKISSDDQKITVVNNLQRRTAHAEPSSGIGLENIRKRYELLSGRVDVTEDTEYFSVSLSCINASAGAYPLPSKQKE